MAKKEHIKGGIRNLLGEGAPEDTQQPKAQEAEATNTAQATEEEESELIKSIDDPELKRLVLERRAARKQANRNKGAKKTTQEGYSRTSLIINDTKYAKVKEIAFRCNLTTKVAIEAAMDLLIKQYEDKHGEVVPNPQKYQGSVNDLFN